MARPAHASTLRWLATLLALAAAAAGRAEAPGQIPVQTFAPAPPGDALFTVPDVRSPGHLAPAAGLVLSYAHEPLVLERNGRQVAGGQLVREQLWGFAQASLGLGSRLRLDAALPVALLQRGDRYFSSVPRVASSAPGDVRLGALASLARLGPLDLGAGVDVWLPSGSRRAYAGDGGLRALPKLVIGGEAGSWVYGAQAGALLARRLDVDYARTGSGLGWGGGAAWRRGAFRVGPEAWGQLGFAGSRSPSEVLLGGHWRPGSLDLGLAISTAIVRDAGAAPFRVVLSAAWRPASWPPAPSEALAAPAAEPAPEPAPAAAPKPEPAAAPPPEPPEPPAAEAAAPSEPGPPPRSVPVPAAPSAPAQVPFALREAVRFDLDRHSVKEADLRRLQEVADTVVARPEIERVLVDGHTDSSGAKPFNRWLSLQRAEAVRSWLLGHGVAPQRVTVRGFGPDRPAASNATRAGRITNRRVEIVLQVR